MSASGTLILGWGNPGRLDDGLGPAFAEALEKTDLPGVTVDADYQLQMEDAAEVARFERVVFVDADRGGSEPFWLRRLYPSPSGAACCSSFTTHSVSPNAILTMTRDLFDAEPEAWLLGIRGYEFGEFGEGLSNQATANLAEAVEFISSALSAGSLLEAEPAVNLSADSLRL